MDASDKCSERRWVVLGTAVLLMLGGPGCVATRNFVRTRAVQPLEAKIQGVDKKVDTKTTELDSRITDVDRKSEQGISEAANRADAAGKDAQKANQAAQGAQQTADKAENTATQAQQQIDNIDSYQPVKTVTVLFGVNRADLTDDDKREIDSLAQTTSSLKHYAIAVEGFTDKTGSKEYNLELSRRRADAVARYLTETAHVPLVKIHMLGLGEAEPAADNKTGDGRKQNRRVEIRIMAPQTAQQAGAQRAADNPPANQ